MCPVVFVLVLVCVFVCVCVCFSSTLTPFPAVMRKQGHTAFSTYRVQRSYSCKWEGNWDASSNLGSFWPLFLSLRVLLVEHVTVLTLKGSHCISHSNLSTRLTFTRKRAHFSFWRHLSLRVWLCVRGCVSLCVWLCACCVRVVCVLCACVLFSVCVCLGVGVPLLVFCWCLRPLDLFLCGLAPAVP